LYVSSLGSCNIRYPERVKKNQSQKSLLFLFWIFDRIP